MQPPLAWSDCLSDPSPLKANIYIRNFCACIADFGISTIARTEPRVGENMGTTASLVSFNSGGCPRWTSPELLDPKKFNASGPRPTKESDRFALGMVIYEVRSCELPTLVSPFSYGVIGVVRTRTVRHFGSREDQRCDIGRSSTVQTKGGGTSRTC